ncbi:protein adenylyltransferase SelO [Salisediminibacterium halotolerans]|uniref:protein adenylyltransferase SelO n=1 Tax=Salisediminibacterium halotolerans TaxID=517425 RepID=UPI000EB072EF|nr:YdiU family protein [Salisediminibacterium halotolerans]RLJ71675.1 uncharacterized protein YdiU (UPF0061 family) [Actinophytocola xinjiangensis]RPE86825.1 uncharacterized protein YdiU (UPF0061 family) [Salisediminibacterium halotolerans]TWG32888.1 uncharacterized protein YdiU (UPF0061 family) [Salisediminibacterium halotolerans]GEL06980.1 UPF0061 protein [Salisediminibacterium halotolerans]
MTNDLNKTAGWNLTHSYAKLPQMFYTPVDVQPVAAPELVLFNEPLALEIGLNPEVMKSAEGVAVLAGNSLPKGAFPLAQAYAGHQFGNFTMLGDGRALMFGEQLTPDGRRIDIQLKGSGATPYSRGADGRASLGPMLREYIISEAMHALGIPTNRSLSVVKTGEQVRRQTMEPGAVLTRTAASHLRVGTFEYASAWGSTEQVRTLADYALERHFPPCSESDNPYLYLLDKTAERQADLIARWQAAGFIHGVMNTDNMAISGETIDYGPCAFIDAYDPKTVFSSIDRGGRYAFGNQPKIAGWNLARFAETLLPLIDEDEEAAVEKAQQIISGFMARFDARRLVHFRAKLGLKEEHEGDGALIDQLLEILLTEKADFTNAFRALTFKEVTEPALEQSTAFSEWKETWKARLAKENRSEEAVQMLMKQSNPAVIPRNHRVEQALHAAVEDGDYSVLYKLLDVLSDPYAHSKTQEAYTAPPPASFPPYQTYCGT